MMRRSNQLSRAKTLWVYTKIAIIGLAVSLALFVFLLDVDDNTLSTSIHVPSDKVAVDVDLGTDTLQLDVPRTDMRHQDAVVLLEDLAILRPSNRLTLPTCAPGVKINTDQAALEKVRHCSGIDWSKSRLPPELVVWSYTPYHMCEGKITVHHRDVALFRDVILDKAFCEGPPCTEDVHLYLGSGYEKSDKVVFHEGFFLVPCGLMRSDRNAFRGGGGNHVSTWMNAVVPYDYPQEVLVDDVVSNLTIAIRRYEYWNIYHTMSDLYNAYMATRFYNVSTRAVNIVFLDGGGRGPYFQLWEDCFQKVIPLSHLSDQTLFRDLFWNKLGYSSELLAHSDPYLPLVEDFRQFVLDSNDLQQGRDKPDCSNLNILLISRHNYDNRTLARQIHNEKELEQSLIRDFHNVKVRKVQLEQLSVKEQLQLVIETDILLGMHGAGLTHSLFLPVHAGVIEFLPHPDSWNLSDGHFRGISRWRNLRYIRWQNDDRANEVVTGVATDIPVSVLKEKVSDMIQQICKKTF